LAKSSLTKQQRANYGKYNGSPTSDQLAQYFYLDDRDLEEVEAKRTDQSRMGYALQLCTLRFLGTPYNSIKDVPLNAAIFVAKQLKIRNVRVRHEYTERRRSTHLTQLKNRYGYRDFKTPTAFFKYLRWLYARLWTGDESFHTLFDLSTRFLVTHKILLPGVTVLERTINRTRRRCQQRMMDIICRQLDSDDQDRLDLLLKPYASENTSELNDLRSPLPNVNSTTINAMMDKLDRVREVNIKHVDVSAIPKSKLQVIAKRVHKAHASNLRRMPNDQRWSFLLIFVLSLETQLVDQIMDLVDAFIAEMQRKVKSKGQKDRLRTLKELDEAARLLCLACSVVVDESVEPDEVRDKVFKKVSSSKIEDAMRSITEIARSKDDQNQKEWLDNFHRIKRFLPRLVASVTLKATVAGQPLLEGLQYLVNYFNTKSNDPFDPPMDHVPKSWRKHVQEKNTVNLEAYTVCTTKQFRESLIRRDVFIVDSDSWNDPRLRLLRGKAWHKVKPAVCRALDLSEQPEPKLNALKQQLDASYQYFVKGLPNNDDVRIEQVGGKPKLIISPLDALSEPASLGQLRDLTRRLMPLIDLPELLLEIDARTSFTQDFFHVSENESRASDLHISLCAVLMAEACNIGLEPLIQPGNPALTRGRLKWVKKNYLRPETIEAANKTILWFHSAIPLVKKWGGGQVASADGLRFITPAHTAYTRHNKLYFAGNPGVTYYNFITDQFAGFHGLLIPGTMRDSLYLLQALLDQDSHLDPREIMTDTAGVSDVVFGLFWLLGFQFSPRIADMGSMRFWRADKQADYGAMNPFCNHQLKMHLPEDNWEDILRVSGSLKLGKIGATELIRSLLHYKRPTTLAKSIGELGKAAKTIHALRTMTDKAYRRRILTQLNRTESRHSLARAICYGNSGELRQPYKDGQEDQLGCLGLVTNIVVLWNTLYLEATLNYLKDQGFFVRDEDVTRLSPLTHEHIHMLGRYMFVVDPAVEAGLMRPIKERNEIDEYF